MTTTVQLYCEMIPLGLLNEPPFTGTSPLLGAMRQHLDRRLAHRGGARLELVLRVTLHNRDSVLGTHTGIVQQLLSEPEAWGVDFVRLWPQLTERDGVYLNGSSMGTFFRRLHQLLDVLEAAGIPLPPLLYDVEPSKQVLDAFLVEHRGVLTAGLAALRRAFGPEARARHARMATALLTEMAHVRQRYAASAHRGAAKIPMHTASIFPAFQGRARRMLEQALTTPTVEPISGQPIFDGLEGMAYGSLVRYPLPDSLARISGPLAAGYVGLVGDQHWHWCAQNGLTAGILLGCTGVGLLGNEPTFAHPGELASQARAVNVARWDRIGVYNLRGLIADGELPIGSRDWRPWLDALLGATSRRPSAGILG